jgi:DNA-binding transcriptional MerR regulator
MHTENMHFPLYNIGMVTKLTGVPVATLRAWEKRYHFPASTRSEGGHRLFSEQDVLNLRWLKEQVDSGITISQAVRILQNAGTNGDQKSFEKQDSMLETRHLSFSGAGFIGTSSLTSHRQELMAALINNDLVQADRHLGELLTIFSSETIALDVILPILADIGEGWEQGYISIASEHLASNYLRQRMLMWMMTGPEPRHVDPIMLACAPGEWHEGSLLLLGMLLRHQGWPVAYLGQNVPLKELSNFIINIAPSMVVMVAMLESTASEIASWPDYIPIKNGKPLLAFGGRAFVMQPKLAETTPGYYLGDTIPEGIERINSLLEE